MRSKKFPFAVVSICGLLMLLASIAAAQTQPYYIADGDADTVYVVQNGALQFSFDSSAVGIGYALAVRTTVLLGDLNDSGSVEYTLAGVATGAAYVGGGGFTQLLDGTTDGVQFNYGVECCGPTNSVTRADLNWQGMTALFDLPTSGSGIAYDTSDDSLWVSLYDGTVRHYTLAGVELSQFTPAVGGTACGVAYDEVADTLWMTTNGGSTIFEFDKIGVLLNSIAIPGFSPSNDWGGEMPITGAAPLIAGIPTLGQWGLAILMLGIGLAGVLAIGRIRFA